eukprot:TRINITY_DN13147_c1_g1_i1.p1 TRINITY_DN13147_c1_g1~~TRINITY_DN13147_c1_g1_i1.p1  ORF type:complete len:504 (-),score=76.19 TRINITY_DN13147_c1_g1_i1:119-1630(-)
MTPTSSQAPEAGANRTTRPPLSVLGAEAAAATEAAAAEIVAAREQHAMRLIFAHQLSAVSISLLTFQSRAQLLAEAVKGDVSIVARQINHGAAAVALSDFLLSPMVGAASDRFGRKPFMLLAPAVALPLKALVVWNPTVLVLLLERCMSDAFRTLGGTTMSCASLSDIFTGERYTAALSRLNSASGLAIVLAPLVASAMGRLGGARRAYVAATLLASAHLVMGASLFEETLGWEERFRGKKVLTAFAAPALTEQASSLAAEPDATLTAKESSIPATEAASAGSVSLASTSATPSTEVRPPTAAAPPRRVAWPGCLRLFSEGGRRLRLRTCLFSLHCLFEGKVIQDQVSVLQLTAGWSLSERARWTSGLGLAILVGAQVAGPLIRRLGEQGFTALCHAASVAAFLRLRGASFWDALAFLIIGQQRRSASVSWVVGAAGDAGIPRGECIGLIASLRAAIDFLAAVIFGGIHQLVSRYGRPLDVMLFPTFLSLLSEVLRIQVAKAS